MRLPYLLDLRFRLTGLAIIGSKLHVVSFVPNGAKKMYPFVCFQGMYSHAYAKSQFRDSKVQTLNLSHMSPDFKPTFWIRTSWCSSPRRLGPKQGTNERIVA